MSREPIIEFKDVYKSFGDKLILEGVSFKIFPGETFCLIGGSGTGKSVSLKILLGLEDVDSGQVLFKGQDLASLSEKDLSHIRVKIGMVFQGSALFDSMTVFENVAYPLEEQGDFSDDEIERIVKEKLQTVNLVDTVDLYPGDLSGGMKKRIGVARAIANSPSVVLYDEPTAGLDPANVKRIDQLINHLKTELNVTSVLVTHNMESVYHVADRVALLFDKRICFEGTMDEFKNTNNQTVRRFVSGDLGYE